MVGAFRGSNLYHCMSVGNLKYIVQSLRGEPVFR